MDFLRKFMHNNIIFFYSFEIPSILSMIFLFPTLPLWSMPKSTIDIELPLADKQCLPVEWRTLRHRCLRRRSFRLLMFLNLNIFSCFFCESISLNDEAEDVPTGNLSFHSKPIFNINLFKLLVKNDQKQY
mgnify:CR=1 FL=1